MGPGPLRAGREIDQHLSVLMQELPSTQERLYPRIYQSFVENVQQRLLAEPTKEPVVGSPRQNVRLSFASVHCASEKTMVMGGASEEFKTSEPWKWTWKVRLPFFDDTNPLEAEAALNHVYAGTMARTLSQVHFSISEVEQRYLLEVDHKAGKLRCPKRKTLYDIHDFNVHLLFT